MTLPLRVGGHMQIAMAGWILRVCETRKKRGVCYLQNKNEISSIGTFESRVR